MPYLKPEDREAVLDRDTPPVVAGEVNFIVTQIIDAFIVQKGLSYATLNEAIGALECAKLELYRRVVGPYEDTKIKANGDVYSAGIVP